MHFLDLNDHSDSGDSSLVSDAVNESDNGSQSDVEADVVAVIPDAPLVPLEWTISNILEHPARDAPTLMFDYQRFSSLLNWEIVPSKLWTA